MKYIFIFLVLITVSITIIGYFQYRQRFVKVDIEKNSDKGNIGSNGMKCRGTKVGFFFCNSASLEHFLGFYIEERVANLVKECQDNLLEDDYNFILRNASKLSYRDRPKIVSLKAQINFFQANINSLEGAKDETRITLLARTCDQAYSSASMLADNLIKK